MNINTHSTTQSPPEDLKLRVERALDASTYQALRGLTVCVDGDEVSLSGTVRSYYEKQQATTAVLQVDGVESIRNQLKVASARRR